MKATKITTKRIPEKRFRVKENKCPLRKAIHTSWIGISSCRCTGCKKLKTLAQNPAKTKNKW
jgi:hypothetical protein